tara:strand:- start:19 stop:648 length:630 start_codon:yes stop_codon:yes gene_type:complete
MQNEHVYDTNSGPILEAITEGKTVIAFLFSNLDPEFYNVHASIPTLEEANAIYNLLKIEHSWDWDIELAMISKYVLSPDVKAWLQSSAPAGFVTCVCESLLACAMPTDPDEIETLLNVTRGSQHLYDQFKSVLLQTNTTHSDLSSIDVFKLLKLAIASEPYLVRQGILENGFSLTRTKEAPASNTHVKNYGVIDTEAANADLRKQGFIK